MIQFSCPVCGQSISVADEAAGKTGKCACGEMLRVPEAKKLTDDDVQNALGPETTGRVHDCRDEKTMGEGTKPRLSKTKWIVCGTIGGIVAGVVGTFILLNVISPYEASVTQIVKNSGAIEAEGHAIDKLRIELEAEVLEYAEHVKVYGPDKIRAAVLNQKLQDLKERIAKHQSRMSEQKALIEDAASK